MLLKRGQPGISGQKLKVFAVKISKTGHDKVLPPGETFKEVLLNVFTTFYVSFLDVFLIRNNGVWPSKLQQNIKMKQAL